MDNLTIEDLKKKRAEELLASEKAILQNNLTYRELKKIVHRINAEPLDVAEYYHAARRLGEVLHEMATGHTNTVFHYFADHIDPSRKGDVRCFRMECLELAQQIKELDDRRAKNRRLRVVK